jgi:TM2 domain-containing membrane protein YozV
MGAHRFYTGKIWTGILMALTTGGIVYWSLWGIGIWVVVDLIFILGGAFRDKEGRLIYYWTEKV